MRSNQGTAAIRGAATRRLRLALVLFAGAVAAGLAGCGGSKGPSVANVATPASTGTNADHTSGRGSPPNQTPSALEYARCMRRHGVPSFPDPSGGGFTLNPGDGVDPSAPAFEAAQAKCRQYTPMGGDLAPGTQTKPSAQWLATMVKAAQCMRRHGVPSFPDPVTTIPSPTILGGGRGVISDIEGAVFVFPAATIDLQSPVFARAAKTCGFPLHNH